MNPSEVAAGETVTVTVSATDPDGDPMAYAYVPTAGGIVGDGPSVSWISPSSPGAHSVNVIVSDGRGGETTRSAALIVSERITSIRGSAGLQVGQSGDLSNSRVALYADYTDWQLDLPAQFVAATGSGPNVTFELSDIPAGTWYLDVWKDNDNSGDISYGDFFGFNGNGVWPSVTLSPITVNTGQTETVDIQVGVL